MRLAISEALKGRGMTAPNPIVGAVIVKEGTAIASGYHARAGEAHAEVAAISNLRSPEDARGAILYVTLEPCSTTGKTPPCTEAIIKAGFARVVYAATDPNPNHQGKAKAILETAGISVTTDVLAEECTNLNRYWNHRIKTDMPWVIAKCGMSLNGCLIAPPGQRWITSQESRLDAMKLRSEVDAILVGGETVRTDNPALTIRGLSQEKNHLQPWRIIWTRSQKNIPQKSQLLTDEYKDKTLIMKNISLCKALQNLALQGINLVMIEGGGETLRAAFKNQLVDEIRFYVAPLLLAGPSWMTQKNHIPVQHTRIHGHSTFYRNFSSAKGQYSIEEASRSSQQVQNHDISLKISYSQEEMVTCISEFIAPLDLKDISYRRVGCDIVVSALVKK